MNEFDDDNFLQDNIAASTDDTVNNTPNDIDTTNDVTNIAGESSPNDMPTLEDDIESNNSNFSSRNINYWRSNDAYERNRSRIRTRSLSSLFNNSVTSVNRPLFQSPLYNGPPRTNNLLNVENLVNNSLYQKNAYKKVLSWEGFQQLQYCVFTKYEYEHKTKYKYTNNSCCISQRFFEENEIVVMLPCCHIFDPNFILYWLTDKQAKCPVCRFELKSIERKVETPKISPVENLSSRNEIISSRTPVISGESSNVYPNRNLSRYFNRSTISNLSRSNRVTAIPRTRYAPPPPPPPTTPPSSRTNVQYRRIPISTSLETDSDDDYSLSDIQIEDVHTESEGDDLSEDDDLSLDEDNNESVIHQSVSETESMESDEPITSTNMEDTIDHSEPLPQINTINDLLHNLRSISTLISNDSSLNSMNDANIASRYNYIENAIENSYLESDELQRTLYESLNINRSHTNNNAETTQDHATMDVDLGYDSD